MKYQSPYDAALERIKELEESLEKETKLRQAYEDALNPNYTKHAYIGEIKFTHVIGFDRHGGEKYAEITIPWTATKDMMKMIEARAKEMIDV